MPTPLVVQRFDAALHSDDLVSILLELQDSDPPYPSPVSSSGTQASLRCWLAEDPPAIGWVATRGPEVLGHVRVTDPHDYLVSNAPAMGLEIGRGTHGEVVKFFVSPAVRRGGVGRTLLAAAVDHIHSSGRRPVLAVLDGATGAIAFYGAAGLVEVGVFEGDEGLNHVFMGPEGR